LIWEEYQLKFSKTEEIQTCFDLLGADVFRVNIFTAKGEKRDGQEAYKLKNS